MNFFQRMILYFREMFPPLQTLIASFGSFYALYYLVARSLLTQDEVIPIRASSAFLGAITYFLFLLLLRNFDELKDVESDKKYFPQRCIPSGKVKISDIKIIALTSAIIMIFLNAYFGTKEIFLSFLFLLFFGYLTYKWFFLKSLISNNLLLAFITHQPVIPIMNFYGTVVILHDIQKPLSSMNGQAFLAILYFWTLGALWEMSRKIRAPEKETEYQTYSKLFGFKRSIVLVIIISIFSSALAIKLLDFDLLAACFLILFLLYFCFHTVNFVFRSEKYEKGLKPFIETYMSTCIGFILCIGIIHWMKTIGYHAIKKHTLI